MTDIAQTAPGSGASEHRGKGVAEEESLVTILARAFGGAVFFSLPLLMTMEMWWLGFYMSRVRLAIFLLVMIPVLIGVSHFSGLRTGTSLKDDVADAFVAYLVAFVASVLTLALFGVIDPLATPFREVVGKTALQAVPASLGAILANSQFGSASQSQEEDEEERQEREGYWSELFLMLVGALFLAFNVAPTEEMVLIALKATSWHAIGILLATLAMMHGFVYSSGFRGSPERPEGVPGWQLFLKFSVVGYAIALLASAYVLWTLGRFEEQTIALHVMMVVVLGLPAGLGAAAARLIL